MKIKPSLKKKISRTLLYFLLILTTFLVSLPILWMISFAFKPAYEQFKTPPTLLIEHLTLENFEKAIKFAALRYLFNSFLVSSVTTLLVIGVSILSAYCFSRLNFFGKKKLFYIIIFTQAFPLASIIIPLYKLMYSLHLLDTYFSLIIAYLTFTVPTAVWLLRGFILRIPMDLEYAALLDGCDRINAFIRILLPVIKPGIIATAVYIFIVTWQEFMFALTFISTPDLKTLPVGILIFVGQLGLVDWGGLMASSLIVCIPVFLLFLILQKQLVSALTGAFKA
jgi:multiple sugar transport system permease protein/raffinose/stachyose/melibiose transport system permease protein